MGHPLLQGLRASMYPEKKAIRRLIFIPPFKLFAAKLWFEALKRGNPMPSREHPFTL